MITDLEPDILECEVKWALESITMNKASGGDGIPVELFQILKDDAVKVLHSICQQIWKTQQWPTAGQTAKWLLEVHCEWTGPVTSALSLPEALRPCEAAWVPGPWPLLFVCVSSSLFPSHPTRFARPPMHEPGVYQMDLPSRTLMVQ